MLPNDFVVLWENDNHPSRYVNKFDGSFDLMIRDHGNWVFHNNIPENVAARAFHEAESVYALVDRSKPKTEELPAIPACVYWSEEQDNFYDTNSNTGMGNSFYWKWKDRHSEFPKFNAAFFVKSFPSERQR